MTGRPSADIFEITRHNIGIGRVSTPICYLEGREPIQTANQYSTLASPDGRVRSALQFVKCLHWQNQDSDQQRR